MTDRQIHTHTHTHTVVAAGAVSDRDEAGVDGMCSHNRGGMLVGGGTDADRCNLNNS